MAAVEMQVKEHIVQNGRPVLQDRKPVSQNGRPVVQDGEPVAQEEVVVPEIQTFVFFDLETSGLSKDTRILELSMIAISRKDLLTMKENRGVYKGQKHGSSQCPESQKKYGPPLPPRVLHKYTRLYYPRKLIYPQVEKVTGLSNESLHHLSRFTADSASSIKLFLDLPPPVCLVAHNGETFDFPILKAELVNVGVDNLADILCTDSLKFARHFEAEDIKAITEIASTFSDFDDMSSVPQDDVQNCNNATISNGDIVEISSTPPKKKLNLNDLPMLDANSDIFKTPEKLIFSNDATNPPQKPPKHQHNSQNGSVTPEHDSNSKNTENNDVANTTNNEAGSKKRAVKRTLYDREKSPNSKKPFSQPVLYRRIFRISYNTHTAESDAYALMEICSFFGQDFTNWADKNTKQFGEVKPRWTLRKSFAL